MREEFIQYIGLLLNLHRIAPLGNYDDCQEEADAILERMEHFDGQFTSEEVQMAKDLSAALYIVAEGK